MTIDPGRTGGTPQKTMAQVSKAHKSSEKAHQIVLLYLWPCCPS